MSSAPSGLPGELLLLIGYFLLVTTPVLVCMQIQKEEASTGLFGKKRELALANKTIYQKVCEDCKKKSHTKNKCWVLNPHLKLSKGKNDWRMINKK